MCNIKTYTSTYIRICNCMWITDNGWDVYVDSFDYSMYMNMA